MRVTIVGLGYVGSVMAACLAEMGHSVVGYDVDLAKVNALKSHRAPIYEPGLQQLVEKNCLEGRLTATSDTLVATLEADILFFCVGTPSKPSGEVDISFLQSALATFGSLCHGGQTLVIRSTIPPGSSEKLFAGRNNSAYNPEFMREGVAIADFFSPSRTIWAALDGEANERLVQLYKDLPGHKLRFPDFKIAEACKYVDNMWHATKIAFTNEVSEALKLMGVEDTKTVFNIFALDKKLNISAAYMKPGFAFGGSCLPKDLDAFTFEAAKSGAQTPFLDAISYSNDLIINELCCKILDCYPKKVGLIGLSFKQGTTDLRMSPAIRVQRCLEEQDIPVAVYEPLLDRTDCLQDCDVIVRFTNQLLPDFKHQREFNVAHD